MTTNWMTAMMITTATGAMRALRAVVWAAHRFLYHRGKSNRGTDHGRISAARRHLRARALGGEPAAVGDPFRVDGEARDRGCAPRRHQCGGASDRLHPDAAAYARDPRPVSLRAQRRDGRSGRAPRARVHDLRVLDGDGRRGDRVARVLAGLESDRIKGPARAN